MGRGNWRQAGDRTGGSGGYRERKLGRGREYKKRDKIEEHLRDDIKTSALENI